MLGTIIALFSLAAILGVILISYVLNNKNTPKSIVFMHGPIAAVALVLLIIYAFIRQPAPIVSIILFILAAFGGIILFYRDITGKTIPKWLAMVHGITAIIGFVFLLIFTFMPI